MKCAEVILRHKTEHRVSMVVGLAVFTLEC